MNVELPDGTVLNDIPDGTTKDQILSKLKSNGYDIRPLLSAENNNKVDPTEGMSGAEKFTAGAGKAFVDIGRGVKQMFSNPDVAVGGAGLNDNGQFTSEAARSFYQDGKNKGQQLQQDIDESRRLDAPLMNTGAGLAGNITGNVAALAPTAFIPGANTLAGAAAIGAGSGSLSPTTTDESRIGNMAMGAGAGMLGHGAGKLLGRALRPVAPSIGAEQNELAKAAAREGIPLRVSQTTGSKPLAITESVMENLPFTSGKQVALKEAQKAAFNKAVLNRAGITADKASPEVLLAQKKALGTVFENIASNNKIDFNKGVTDKLATIGNEASRRLAKPQPITNTIDDIISDVDKSGFLDGKKYQGWRETLGRMASGSDSEAHYAGQVKRSLDDAFNTQLSGSDATAWKQASKQYGNLKNILQAMGGAGTDQLSGNIPPSQLSSALTRQVGKEGKALGRGDLNELSKIGRSFISENIPDSGTAQRTFYQNLLTGNLAGAIPGAGIGYYQGGPEGALAGAAIGAGTALAGPKLAQALMNSKAGQAYLQKGIAPLTQAHRDALANALRTGATGLALTNQ